VSVGGETCDAANPTAPKDQLAPTSGCRHSLRRQHVRAPDTYAGRIDTLEATWRQRLGRVRANSAVELLLDLLPGVPVITVESAAGLIGRSQMRTGEAVNRLEAAGILRQRNIGRQRYRVFEASDVIDLFTGLERALANPTRNTAWRR